MLFSAIYDPAPLLNRWAATDQMAYRLTRGQGIFTLNEHAHAWPLHLLAQNVGCESVVLEWPSLEEFESECASGDYDYVCITFMNRDLTKLHEMSASVRRLSPRSKIVIGGYGVICLPDDQAARHEADYDHICRGEGVRFLRTLVGEPVDQPVSCYLPQSGARLPWLSKRNRGTVGAVLAGLGCIQRCPFCVTSFYAKGGFIPVLDEQQLYEAMVRYWKVNPFTSTVNVYDENFLDYKDRVEALGRLIRQDGAFGLRHLNYFTFGSVSAVCKYDAEELLLNGVDTVWIGVESKFTQLKKTKGAEPGDIFDALHAAGIKTIGSMILGLDVQNEGNVVADEDFFVRLNPTFQQISILTVEPSMPLARMYQKQKQQKYPWENYHLYGQTYEPKNFTFDELLQRADDLYKRLYFTNGPSIARLLRCNLNGYSYCRRSSHPLLRSDKLEFFERRLRSYVPLLAACIEFAPGDQVRHALRELQREVVDTFGPPTDTQRAFSDHVLRSAAKEFAERGDADRPIINDEFRRYVYPARDRRPALGKPYSVSYPRRCVSVGAVATPRESVAALS
jgi:haloalkane dehalogenase